MHAHPDQSGNCVRNVTTDHFAGRRRRTSWSTRVRIAEVLRQWSTFHPEFTFLPRKFKIAVSAASADRAAVQVHDIGLRLVRDEQGALGFEVWAGGGLGRTPVVAPLIKPFLPERELLNYVEAILRVYNRFGRRDNLYKARIKILVRELGATAFADEVEQEWDALKGGRGHADRCGNRAGRPAISSRRPIARCITIRWPCMRPRKLSPDSPHGSAAVCIRTRCRVMPR